MSSGHGSGSAVPPPQHHHNVDAEFGAITGAVVEHHDRIDSDSSENPDCVTPCALAAAAAGLDGPCSPEKIRRRQRQRLKRHLWHRRWIRQYFREEGVLVREPGLRKIGNEELYLDLIIVANIAALGQDLKSTFKGWFELEKFILLFGAVYSSWRSIAFLWNMFGTKGDLVDKVGVYCAHAAMSGIGLGSRAAFTTARKHVAVSAFLASAIPIFSHIVFAIMEPDTSNEHNMFDQIIGMQVLNSIGILPYLCAVFVTSERAARALYWVPLIWMIWALPIYNIGYRELHKNRPKARRTAVNVEALVEKYGVLTLIVLGESLLALIVQGAELVVDPKADIGLMFVATAASVLIVYSMQTIYFNVDQNLGRGSVHAIRHNGRLGLIWSQLHIPYHMALAGFVPTGLAKLIKQITLRDKKSFPANIRQLFSIGWGAAFVISAIFSLLHKAGPRERTRNHRICCRIVVVLAVAIGMAFADIRASYHLIVFALVSSVLALIEFILLEADRIGMLRGSPIPSTAPSSIGEASKDSLEDGDDDMSSEMDSQEDHEEVKPGSSVEMGPEVDASWLSQTRARRDARRRQRRFGCKFEVVCQRNKARKAVCDEQS